MSAAKTVKIFKKASSNGKVFLYLGNRDYIACDGNIQPITGVVNVLEHKETLKGKRIFVQLIITFRHGREDEETMGLSFKKELILDRVQIYPPPKKQAPEETIEETKLQTRMIQKLGDGTYPYSLNFPPLAPNSVIICSDEEEDPTNVI